MPKKNPKVKLFKNKSTAELVILKIRNFISCLAFCSHILSFFIIGIECSTDLL